MGPLSDWLRAPLPWAGDVATLSGALLAGFLVYLSLVGLRWLARRRLRRVGPGMLEEMAQEGMNRVHRPILLAIAITVTLRLLPLPEPLQLVVHQGQWLILAAQFAIWADLLANVGAMAFSRTLSEGKYHFPGLQLGIKLVLWLLVAITTLDNMGVNLGSLLTGLGIGGITVALAAQRVISDMISTATIAMDRPFMEGDFIAVGDTTGQVLRIGLKTTRLRSPTGEELIIPNADLVSLKVRNLSRLDGRKVIFNVTVGWSTPASKLEQLPWQLEALFQDLSGPHFEHAFLTGTGDAGYHIEVVYSVPEMTVDPRVHQDVLLRIARLLEQEGISPRDPSAWKTPSPAR